MEILLLQLGQVSETGLSTGIFASGMLNLRRHFWHTILITGDPIPLRDFFDEDYLL
jgi:hypothetical protein